MTLSERDIWASANVLIKRYGGDAKMQAAQRADDLLREGDFRRDDMSPSRKGSRGQNGC
jgi:hypothetical protein